MKRIWIAAALMAGVALAQNSTPEVRGRVIDSGLSAGLPGVEMILTSLGDDNAGKRVSVFTDATGAFSFKPDHLGDFRLDAQKPGYEADSSGVARFFTLTREQPSMNLNFRLMIPATITGRIVDEEGKPVKTFPLGLRMTTGQDAAVVTNEEGFFTKSGLVPGEYLATVGPGFFVPALDFSEEEFKKTDRDTKFAYWPGDVADKKFALPLPVRAGQQTNLGTITIHEIDFHRVHVSVANCEGNESLGYRLVRNGQPNDEPYTNATACRKDFILPSVEPGSYTLLVSATQGQRRMWAAAPVEVTDKNVHVELALSPSVEVKGHFVAPEGQELPMLRSAGILFEPEPAEIGADALISPDAQGTFTSPPLSWGTYLVAAIRLPPTHYVKEVRYDHRPMTDGIITLSPDAALELVLDDQPALLSGTIEDFEKAGGPVSVVLRRRVRSGAAEASPQNLFAGKPDDHGKFTAGGLAPGDYEIEAVVLDPRVGLTENILHYNPRAQTVSVERGDRKTLDLKVTPR